MSVGEKGGGALKPRNTIRREEVGRMVRDGEDTQHRYKHRRRMGKSRRASFTDREPFANKLPT